MSPPQSNDEPLVVPIAEADFPSAYATTTMRIHAFQDSVSGLEHVAIVNGPLSETPLVRVHSECLTGDALGSLRCDCGAQLQQSLRLIGESGGIVVYLRGQEGRGIGLANKIRAYALQDAGRDTVQSNTELGFAADTRSYAVAAQILSALGIKSIDLLTNNPAKAEGLAASGIAIRETRPLVIQANALNARYLATKRDKLGHELPL